MSLLSLPLDAEITGLCRRAWLQGQLIYGLVFLLSHYTGMDLGNGEEGAGSSVAVNETWSVAQVHRAAGKGFCPENPECRLNSVGLSILTPCF